MSKQTDNTTLPDRYVSPETASEFLDIGLATLANWRSLGVGPRYSKLSAGRSGTIRYRLSELERFAADPVAYRPRAVGTFNKPEQLKRGGNPALKLARARARRGKGAKGH